MQIEAPVAPRTHPSSSRRRRSSPSVSNRGMLGSGTKASSHRYELRKVSKASHALRRKDMEAQQEPRLSSVCVFCGSSFGNRKEYELMARNLGEHLASRGSRLVYGGGSVGLMGVLATSAHARGGRVLGIIPQSLVGVELSGPPVDEERVVKDIHERKAVMQSESDAFVVLPGGYGTMEELLEMVTWQQLGYHTKPIGLLDVEGFFQHFLKFLDHMVQEGFVREEFRKILVCGSSPEELLDKLESYEPPESILSRVQRGERYSGNGKRS